MIIISHNPHGSKAYVTDNNGHPCEFDGCYHQALIPPNYPMPAIPLSVDIDAADGVVIAAFEYPTSKRLAQSFGQDWYVRRIYYR